MEKVTESTIQKWFDQLYSTRGLKSMRSFEAYPIFLEYLRAEAGKRLLDIGCGTGFLLKAAAVRGLETYGVDFSEAAVDLSASVSSGSLVSVQNGENLRFEDHYFDYITCIGTLEHFLDIHAGLAEMRRVAKPDASFCIMVPNSKSLLWKLGTGLNLIETESNENAKSLVEWMEIFERTGFTTVTVHRDRWYLKKLLLTLGMDSSDGRRAILKFVIRPVVPLKYANQFIFILRSH